jgi:hypothetical protein
MIKLSFFNYYFCRLILTAKQGAVVAPMAPAGGDTVNEAMFSSLLVVFSSKPSFTVNFNLTILPGQGAPITMLEEGTLRNNILLLAERAQAATQPCNSA